MDIQQNSIEYDKLSSGHFKKYNSIENYYQEDFIDKVRQLFLPQNGVIRHNSWFVTEKIHGCNVQISYDGEQIRYGSRNNFLQDGDKFYNYKEVLGKYEPIIKKMYNELHSVCEIEEVILFGELFGGEYLHPEVEKVKGASKVQKGVQYTPDNNVLFFDICYKIWGKYLYMNGLTFLHLCEEYSLPYVPVLALELTLDEALKYPNDGNSKVYLKYNLPEIENNIMEGIVIRGYEQEYVLPNGTRCIIKSKNDKFKEKSRNTKKIIDKTIPENLQIVLDKLTQYVTPQRVENIISHFGEISVSDIGKIIGETNKDILQDFEKEHNDFNTLEKSEIKCVTRLLNPLVAKEVKEVIYKRIK